MKKPQANGKWRVKEITINEITGTYQKSRTLYKNKTHYEAEELIFKLEKGLKI